MKLLIPRRKCGGRIDFRPAGPALLERAALAAAGWIYTALKSCSPVTTVSRAELPPLSGDIPPGAPALLSYDGIQPATWPPPPVRPAAVQVRETHLRILRLLRGAAPFDLQSPYRLEMGARCSTPFCKASTTSGAIPVPDADRRVMRHRSPWLADTPLYACNLPCGGST